MNRSLLAFAIASGCAAAASGQTLIELTPEYLVTDFSRDGSVAVGNLFGPYETFRWTASTGEVLLGRGTVEPLGVGAGSPDVSYDGTRVSATILDDTGTMATFGLWTEELGWESAESPLGPSNSQVTQNGDLAATWGLSGDGSTVVGFYWTNVSSAHPCLWSPAGGVIPLPVDPGRSARVNASNFDGSVSVGWEVSGIGAWQPTVWRDGMKIRVEESEVSTPLQAVSSTGEYIAGYSYVSATANRHATLWRWNGTEYVKQVLGQLPGTPAFNGYSLANSVSDDGAIAYGTNYYALHPNAGSDPFIWTEATGVVNAVEYFEGRGVVFPAGFDFRWGSTMSPDGRTFAVSGYNAEGQIASLIVRLGNTSACPGDCDGSGEVDFNDLVSMLFAFGPAPGGGDVCDADRSGVVDFNDLVSALFLFGTCGS